MHAQRSKTSPDDPNTARATPKRVKIAGITFIRSKNGNLYRSGLIKNKKYVFRNIGYLSYITTADKLNKGFCSKEKRSTLSKIYLDWYRFSTTGHWRI